jgi:hypothetical protein
LTLRLAQGDLDLVTDGRQRAHELAEMARAVEVFHTTLLERQKLNRETRLLSDLNEWLQSCGSLGELYRMVAEILGRLLPGCVGSLYIYANSGDLLESAKAWNGGKMMPAMHPDDCWGLRRGRPYTIDIDHFKKYNNNHGRDAGDMVLRTVGNCLESLFRNEDILCRFGGEEFVIVLPGADADAALCRAEQLRGKTEEIVANRRHRSGISGPTLAGRSPATLAPARRRRRRY